MLPDRNGKPILQGMTVRIIVYEVKDGRAVRVERMGVASYVSGKEPAGYLQVVYAEAQRWQARSEAEQDPFWLISLSPVWVASAECEVVEPIPE